MFDSKKEIIAKIPSENGYREIVCTFPTDAAWALRSSKSKFATKSIGRGKTVNERVGSFEPDLDCAKTITKDDLDMYEASNLLAKLGRADVVESCREGNQFIIELKVLGGSITKHILRMPSVKESHSYHTNTFSRVNDRNSSIVAVKLEPSGTLYDALLIKNEGYVGDVPLIHKSEIISELITLMAREEEDEDESKNE